MVIAAKQRSHLYFYTTLSSVLCRFCGGRCALNARAFVTVTKEQALSSARDRHLFPHLVAAQARVRATTEGSSLLLKLLLLLLETGGPNKTGEISEGKTKIASDPGKDSGSLTLA